MEPSEIKLERRGADVGIDHRGSGKVGIGCHVELRSGPARIFAEVLDVFPDGSFIGEVVSLDGAGSCDDLSIGNDLTFKEKHIFACTRPSAAA